MYLAYGSPPPTRYTAYVANPHQEAAATSSWRSPPGSSRTSCREPPIPMPASWKTNFPNPLAGAELGARTRGGALKPA
jgi:hypothetical protein